MELKGIHVKFLHFPFLRKAKVKVIIVLGRTVVKYTHLFSLLKISGQRSIYRFIFVRPPYFFVSLGLTPF